MRRPTALRYGWIALGLALVWLFAFGCGEPAEQMPLGDRPAPSRSAKPEPLDDHAASALPDEVTAESADKTLSEKTVKEVYDPINLVDPFAPIAPPDEGADRETTGPFQYEIRFYKLVAMATGLQDPLAMFEDPAGKSFALRVGDAIGREKGTVTGIDDTSVQITTISFDWRGDAKPVVYDVLLNPKTDTSRKK